MQAQQGRPGETIKVELTEETVTKLIDGSYEVDLEALIGQPGIEWRSGILTSDQRPDLRVRYGSGARSIFWDLRTHPTVAGLLRRLTGLLSGANYRLDRPVLPYWQEDDPAAQAALDRQFEYASRIFHRWGSCGQDGLAGWIRTAITTTIIEGYSLFEIVAHPVTMRIGGVDLKVWAPEDGAPYFRAPWSVYAWIHDRERLLGVVAQYGYTGDYRRGSPVYRVVIPAEKLLITRTGALGPSDLGRSWLRDCMVELQSYRQAVQLQNLGIELNGCGEIFFNLPAGGVSETSQNRLETYLLNRKSSLGPGGLLPEGCTVQRLSGEIPNLDPVINRLDAAIARCFNQDSRVIAVQSTGSYAARESAAEAELDGLGDLIRELIGEPIEEYLGRLIRASFPGDHARGYCFVPSLAHSQVEEVKDIAYINSLATAKGAGLLSWGSDDERVLRDLLDLAPARVAPPEVDTGNATTTTTSPAPMGEARAAFIEAMQARGSADEQ